MHTLLTVILGWVRQPRSARALRWLLALAVLLSAARPAGAAVVRDAVSTGYGNSSAFTFDHTVGIGTDRVLIVGVSIFNANKTVTSLTYGGVALTRIGFIDGGTGSNDRRLESWRLVNPPIGTNVVSVNMSSGAKVVAGAVSFFGVNTASPHGAFITNEARTNLVTLAVPSAVGELVLDMVSVTGNAATATVGAGQSQLWNDYSRSNGGSVVGTASTEPGAPMVTMTWGLSTVDYWVVGAISLKPAPPRPYQPDAMIKLITEADAAYFYDYWYENPAALQVKSASSLAGVPVSYRVRIENDGQNPDRFVVTGSASTTAFTVQYLDGSGVDRSADVTGAGYTDILLASGAATTWTLVVTRVVGGAGGNVFTSDMTAASVGDPTKTDQVRAITTSLSPNLVMNKSADLANALPGQDITYSVTASSAGGLGDATGIVVVDSIPEYAGFRIGSASFDAGTSTLTSSLSYSNDDGVTWSYVPGTGSCTAPSGYDYCVTHVRWTLAGIMPPSRTFTVSMAVRVK